MAPSSRRKSKKTNKTKTCRTLTDSTNNHSSLPPNAQLQGHCGLIIPLKKEQGTLPPVCLSYPYVVVEEKKKGNHSKENSFSVGEALISNHSRMEEESYNVDLKEETQKVESLSEDDKEVVLQVADYGSETQEQDYESAVTDDVHKEHVSESVVDSTLEPAVSSSNGEFFFNDAIKDAQIENTTLALDSTVELELKEEEEEDYSVSHESEETHLVKELEETELPPSEDNNEFTSVPENEDSREAEVVETDDKDVKIDEEEEKNVLSSDVVTDVDSKENLETSVVPKSDESENKVPPTTPEEIPREIQKSLEPSKDEKQVVEVQDPSYESAKEYESSQPLLNVPEAESTSVTLPKETEVPRSIENQNNVPETQREYASWSSCCGIFEILMGRR